MNKRKFASMAVAAMLGLCACGCQNTQVSLKGEGIAPYALSDDQQELIQMMAMEQDARIFAFDAPSDAITMFVRTYQLSDEMKWEEISKSGISLGENHEVAQTLTGTLVMIWQEDNSIQFHINSSGRSSFQSEPILREEELLASMKGELKEQVDIVLNQEIPIAYQVQDSGDGMRSYQVEDYFSPTVFESMDLVQFVTVEFTEQQL